MTIRLLADENIARQKVESFRQAGLDVTWIKELGLANRRFPDPAVLRIAHAQGRVVLTHNAGDFKKLHVTTRHSGILILPDDARHERIVEAAITLLQSFDDWAGRLERLHRPAP